MGRAGSSIKAITDWTLALLALIVSSPVLVISMLAIKLDSPGPVFFTQVRVGVGGKPFKIYKLRTMVREAFKGPDLTQEGDPRVTAIGRFLRQTSIDELPQIFNVLKGEMSIVGPRPEVPTMVEEYTLDMREVLKYKPGITGISQISGRAALPIGDKVRMEIEYYERETFLSDLRVVLQTPFAVINGKGNVM